MKIPPTILEGKISVGTVRLVVSNTNRYLNQLSAVDSNNNNNNIWNRHRIIVVGLLNSGKTALIHKLLDKPYTKRSDRMDQGLRIHEWRTRSKTLQFWKRLDSLFDFWDFSGDSVSKITIKFNQITWL